MTDTTEPQPVEAAGAKTSGLRQIYLFALGFPLALADGMGRVFQEAVKQGEAIEPQSAEAFRKLRKGVEVPVQRTRTAVRDLGGRVRAGTSKGAGALEERLAAKLERMGMPTREQLQTLSDRVETLAAEVAELRGRRED